MKKVLVDFSQTAISSVAVFANELKGGDPKNMIKHIILNQLLGLKRRFGGQLIICCDSRSYWRRAEFPSYKGHRKHSKDAGFLDWTMVYEVLGEMKQELSEFFPYKVLEVAGAEADDIIPVLISYFDENELVNTGLIEEPAEIVIVSTDGDYSQLQKYRQVKQWNNVTKKMLVSKNPKQDLIGYICQGQTKDNIPNVCTSDKWAADRAADIPARASPFKTSRLIDFYNRGYDACLNEDEKRNYRRNELLLDFDKIPSSVQGDIIRSYHSTEITSSKKKIYDYLLGKRMKLLIASHSDF